VSYDLILWCENARPIYIGWVIWWGNGDYTLLPTPAAKYTKPKTVETVEEDEDDDEDRPGKPVARALFMPNRPTLVKE
jgi:hypothetical protein